MKKIIMLFAVGAMALGFSACNDDEKNTSITPGDFIYLPRNNYPVDLTKNQDVKFEWKTTTGAFVTYEVLFDKETGDFSNPLYVVPSSNNGYSPEAQVSGMNLSTIALRAGAGPGVTVPIKWTIRVWQGLSSTLYTGEGVRTLQITRPNTVDPLPIQVNVQGTATENQAAIALMPAMPVSATKSSPIYDAENGAFESFTKLSQGDLEIVDDLGRHYWLEEKGTIRVSDTEAPKTTISAAGIYWLYMNFNTMKWSMKKISKVELWNHPWFGSEYLKEMNYDGNGVWSLKDYAWTVADGGNFDTRHYFVATYADGSAERWAHWEDDCRGGNNPENDPKFFRIMRFTRNVGGDDWCHTWKTKENIGEGKNQKATFYLYMNNKKDANFTHTRAFN